MKHFPIEGILIVLYPLVQKHIASYLLHYSLRVQAVLHVQSLEQELGYVRGRLADKNAFFYVIMPKSRDDVIGAIEIRHPAYRSQLYCWLNERYWGKGYFQEALQLLVATYFSLVDALFITARVDCDNERSFYALKKAGFQALGVVSGPYGPQFELVLKK